MMKMGSSGLVRLSCLSIHDQQAIALGHGGEEIQKLSKLGRDRISSQDEGCSDLMSRDLVYNESTVRFVMKNGVQ